MLYYYCVIISRRKFYVLALPILFCTCCYIHAKYKISSVFSTFYNTITKGEMRGSPFIFTLLSAVMHWPYFAHFFCVVTQNIFSSFILSHNQKLCWIFCYNSKKRVLRCQGCVIYLLTQN